MRFDTKELDPVRRLPQEAIRRAGERAARHASADKKPREVYKVLWEGKGERAVLVAQLDKRRASMLVYRGDFEEEIYRVSQLRLELTFFSAAMARA